jgi:prenylcysteine alpha-carboxyl methylesterase
MQHASDHPAGGGGSAEGEAFVPRGGPQQGLRRRTGPVPLDYSSPRSGRAGDGRRSTFREDVGHAAAETYLVTGLAFTLLGYLG